MRRRCGRSKAESLLWRTTLHKHEGAGMHELIVRHYPQSPVSEKVRMAMGLKKLAWRLVEQNRLPDRPELFLMTGGYRRIPVLQIGADLYCDTQCIFRELERRVPSPTFFPNKETGLPFALSRWTDGAMFELAMRVSFAPITDSLPPALVADRTRLYLGPNGDFKREVADLPHTLAQLRAQLGWLDERLSSGSNFLFGDQAGLADLLAWFIVWFLRGRNPQADELLSELPMLGAWERRMKSIGYGTSSPLTPLEALEVARAAEPESAAMSDPRDPQGLKLGMRVAITPLSEGGEEPIEGAIRSFGADTIALDRHHPACGNVAVHFPRVGYRVTPL
jgi:glutathione S-transferase